MTRIGMGLGGQGGVRTMGRATGGQDWRAPPASPRQAVDWSDPKFATPQPAAKQRFPRRVPIPLGEAPQLPERTIRVRAKPPATYYSSEGVPLPADQWVDLPLSPGLLKAIAQGDLEEDKSAKPAAQPAPQHQQHQRRERPAPQQPAPPQAE